SHKLDEVLDLTHHITVLRRGRCVATHALGGPNDKRDDKRDGDIDAATLAREMLGQVLDAASEDGALLDSAMMTTSPRAAGAPAREVAPEIARTEVLRLEAVDVAGDGPGG